MISVPASEFQKKFGRYKELAQKEPVIITSYDRESVVLISADEYKAYQAVREKEATPLYASEIPEDELAEFEKIQPPAEAAAFNRECDS